MFRVEVKVLEAKARILAYQPIGFWLQPVKYQIIKKIPLSYGETYFSWATTEVWALHATWWLYPMHGGIGRKLDNLLPLFAAYDAIIHA